MNSELALRMRRGKLKAELGTLTGSLTRYPLIAARVLLLIQPRNVEAATTSNERSLFTKSNFPVNKGQSIRSTPSTFDTTASQVDLENHENTIVIRSSSSGASPAIRNFRIRRSRARYEGQVRAGRSLIIDSGRISRQQ